MNEEDKKTVDKKDGKNPFAMKSEEEKKKDNIAKAHAHREIRYNDGLYYSFETYRKQLDYDYNKQIREVEEYNKK